MGGADLKGYTLAPLPVQSLCFLCVDKSVIIQPPTPTVLLSLTVLMHSPSGWTLPWNHMSKYTFLKLLLTLFFYYMKKIN